MKKALICCLFLPLLSGCAGSAIRPAASSQPRSRVYQANIPAVYDAALKSLARLEIPVRNTSRESGFINTEFVLVEEKKDFAKIAVCGANIDNWFSPYGSGRYTMNILVTPGKQLGQVEVTATTYMEVFNYSSSEKERCYTNGTLEEQFFRQLQDILTSEVPDAIHLPTEKELINQIQNQSGSDLSRENAIKSNILKE